jgi:lipopolysaccharide biosynthesis glycosyltransferase
LDSDIVVTGSLEPILEAARNGQICAYPDPDSARWFAEWRVLYDLPPLRRQTYVNSGVVAVSTRAWPHFVDRWWELCCRIRTHPTLYQGGRNGPTSQPDQDAFNALMMSEFPPGALVPLAAQEATITEEENRAEVEVLEELSFSCVRQGGPTRLLHWAGHPKPWAPEARARSQRHAYGRLLVRATTWPDAPARLPTSAFPYWMRQDPVNKTRALVRRVAGRTFRSLQRKITGRN